jgi:hypothetical protein
VRKGGFKHPINPGIVLVLVLRGNILGVKFMTMREKDSKIIVFAGLLLASFLLFHFSGANDNKLDYFQDRDQDGLSDEEEKALGTDWQKADTDGDGYTDGVEVSSGYDPLVPAPGDRIGTSVTEDKKVSHQGKGEKKERKNLTKEFIAKLRARKGTAIETFKNANEDGLVTKIDDINKLKGVSLTEEDIQELAKETVGDVDIEEEIKDIPEGELNILPKVVASSSKKKRKKIKKEIEDYLAEVSFLAVNNLPFSANDEKSFNDRLDRFMVGIGQDIVTGNDLEAKQSKVKLMKFVEELKRLETPYVLKDVHKRTVALLQYLTEQDEEVVFRKDDPIAMGVMIGKLQAVITEMQSIQTEMDGILLKYKVGNTEEGEELGKSEEENED